MIEKPSPSLPQTAAASVLAGTAPGKRPSGALRSGCYPGAVKFAIRAYRTTDFETLYAIDRKCYAPEIAYGRAELRWYLRLPGSDCLIAEERGERKNARRQIAGFILSICRKAHGHIFTIDILESHRRRGLGSTLLREAEARLRARGAREVWLETATNNEAAIAFWQKHGYRTCGRMKNYYPGGLDALSMTKPLAESAEES